MAIAPKGYSKTHSIVGVSKNVEKGSDEEYEELLKELESSYNERKSKQVVEKRLFGLSIDSEYKGILKKIYNIVNEECDDLYMFYKGVVHALYLGRMNGKLYVKLTGEELYLQPNNKGADRELPFYGTAGPYSILDLLTNRGTAEKGYGYSFVKRYAKLGGYSPEKAYEYIMKCLSFYEYREFYDISNVSKYKDLTEELLSVDGINDILNEIGDKVEKFVFVDQDNVDDGIYTVGRYMEHVYDYLVG